MCVVAKTCQTTSTRATGPPHHRADTVRRAAAARIGQRGARSTGKVTPACERLSFDKWRSFSMVKPPGLLFRKDAAQRLVGSAFVAASRDEHERPGKPSETCDDRIGAFAVVEKATPCASPMSCMRWAGLKRLSGASDFVIAGQAGCAHQQKRRQHVGLICVVRRAETRQAGTVLP